MHLCIVLLHKGLADNLGVWVVHDDVVGGVRVGERGGHSTYG